MRTTGATTNGMGASKVRPGKRSLAPVRVASALLLGVGIACNDAGEAADSVVELTEVRLYEANDGLNSIRGIAVGRRSDLWAIGSPAPFIHHFDSSGRLIASFGRAGQGPGELATPHGILAPDAMDSLVRVWSPGRAVISTFDENGSFAGATQPVAMSSAIIPSWMDRIEYVGVRPIAQWNRGYLIQDVPPRERGLTSATQIANGRLLVVDSAGAVVDTLVDFRRFTGSTRPDPGVMYLAALPVWTTCDDGSAAVVDPYGMKVLRLSSQGDLTRTDTLPLEVEQLTDEDIRRYMRNWVSIPEMNQVLGGIVPDSMVNRIVEQYLTTDRAQVGTTAPPVVRILCDDDNDLWLQRYDTADDPRGLGRAWVILEDGRIVRRYRFPTGFQPFVFRAGAAIGVQRDSLDVERVAAVRYAR